ncbi:MAG: hypothetical protein KF852_08470 [Saprospiraceae bacterium]|nr:hypothetical protein [Saprospiraceae bacterium]
MNRFVSFIALLLCCAAAVAQSAEAQAGAYLKQHSFEMAQLMQHPAFKKDLKKNALIAVGEVHGNRSSYEVHHQIASRILSQYNLLYLCELDYSITYFINRYFSTGDTTHLDRVFSRFEGTFFYSKEAAQVYKALYEFIWHNKEAKSIHFAGIDVAHIPSIAIDHLRELTAGNGDALLSREGAPLHTLLHLPADSIRYSNQRFMEALRTAADQLNNNSEPYRNALGNLFWDTQYVINNLLKTYDIKTADDEQTDRLRERQNPVYVYDVRRLYVHDSQ